MSHGVSLSAFSIFLAIAAVGFLFLIVSFVFGELFGHADVGAHGGDVHGDIHGISFLNPRVLSVFVTAFGGLIFGGIIYLFARFLFGQQASSGVGVGELVGRTAQISVAIPAGGLGQVRCALGENIVEKLARTVDGGAIPAHTSVTIESIVGETVLVRRTD